MSRRESWFRFVVRHRVVVLAIGLVTLVAAALGASRLVKDTSADAFVDPQNPALLYRKRVEANFGVTDPIVIAVFANDERGIYTPPVLELVRRLSQEVAALPQVDPAKTVSIATEKWIHGTTDGMDVVPLLEEGVATAATAIRLREAVADSPLYRGSLVSADGRATLIVAELLDEKAASAAYAAVSALVERESLPSGVIVHVAGEGAITGYLSSYIDADARRMIPIALLVIVVVLFLAFRTPRGALLPLLVVVGTVLGTLGAMAISGVSYFAITSGMVVALIGIAVADSIHIFNDYYERVQREPETSNDELVVASLSAMLRPVTLTTLTTIAGFLTLWPANTMPPIRWFGVFGAVGVALAWVYTVTLLPAAMAMLPKRASPVLRASTSEGGVGWVMRLGAAVVQHPVATLLMSLAVCALGAAGVLRLQVDYSRIDNFSEASALNRADRAINQKFQGGYHLDVVVIGARDDAIYEPKVLGRIETLQQRMASISGVGGSVSIADYVKQMNRAVNAGAPEFDRLPDTKEAVAQLFLVYTLSGDPTDFEEEVDSARREALVRFNLNTSRWSDHARIVRELEQQVEALFPVDGARAVVTGRVMVDHAWMQGIRDSHFASVALSVIAVLVMCTALFRSLAAGLACVLPVGVAVLAVYAVMGFGSIWLGVATSMFASVAIGLGIDFAIHTLDRSMQLRGERPDVRIMHVYRGTGRPLLFNALAVVLGFGVVMLSEVPPVENFGVLVAVGVAAAFLASMTALTAALVLYLSRHARGPAKSVGATSVHLVLVALVGLTWVAAETTHAATPPVDDLMQRVHTRPEGYTREQTVRVELTDRRGNTRVEQTRVQRLQEREGMRRTIVFYLAPANVRGTAFLTFDHAQAGRDDDQWLYLPALRKVRRIPAADRGDSFFGTDLSYEDIKSDGKPDPTDWRFTAGAGPEKPSAGECTLVEGIPSSPRVANELGVSRARWCIDESTLISRRSEFWDANGNPLRIVTTPEVRRIANLWIATQIAAANLKTGHRTVLSMSDVKIDTPMDAMLFTQQRLARGL